MPEVINYRPFTVVPVRSVAGSEIVLRQLFRHLMASTERNEEKKTTPRMDILVPTRIVSPATIPIDDRDRNLEK